MISPKSKLNVRVTRITLVNEMILDVILPEKVLIVQAPGKYTGLTDPMQYPSEYRLSQQRTMWDYETISSIVVGMPVALSWPNTPNYTFYTAPVHSIEDTTYSVNGLFTVGEFPEGHLERPDPVVVHDPLYSGYAEVF